MYQLNQILIMKVMMLNQARKQNPVRSPHVLSRKNQANQKQTNPAPKITIKHQIQIKTIFLT